MGFELPHEHESRRYGDFTQEQKFKYDFPESIAGAKALLERAREKATKESSQLLMSAVQQLQADIANLEREQQQASSTENVSLAYEAMGRTVGVVEHIMHSLQPSDVPMPDLIDGELQ